GISDFAWYGSASRLGVNGGRVCLDPRLHAYPRTTNAWDHLPSCVPPSLSSPGSFRFVPKNSPIRNPVRNGRGHGGTGISTSCASTTPLGLALAPDLPWAD